MIAVSVVPRPGLSRSVPAIVSSDRATSNGDGREFETGTKDCRVGTRCHANTSVPR